MTLPTVSDVARWATALCVVMLLSAALPSQVTEDDPRRPVDVGEHVRRGGRPALELPKPQDPNAVRATYTINGKTIEVTEGEFYDLFQLLKREEPKSRAVLSANRIVEHVKGLASGSPGERPGDELFAKAQAELEERYDEELGGFGMAPKFPVPHNLRFLLRQHARTGAPAAREMVEKTLRELRKGGVWDHVGFGFHRYSTEPTWSVPHFEKMLYDNALLVLDFVEAYQLSGAPEYLEVARDVLAYVAREMTAPEGTFYSATDADSEGEEGTYFVWTPAQVRSAVGPDRADLALLAYAVTESGNFEGGRTVLRRDRGVREFDMNEAG